MTKFSFKLLLRNRHGQLWLNRRPFGPNKSAFCEEHFFWENSLEQQKSPLSSGYFVNCAIASVKWPRLPRSLKMLFKYVDKAD